MVSTNHSLSGPPTDLEGAARTALEDLSGRRFTDVEWRQLRSRLLEYATILRNWNRGTVKKGPEADKLIILRPAKTSITALDEAA